MLGDRGDQGLVHSAQNCHSVKVVGDVGSIGTRVDGHLDRCCPDIATLIRHAVAGQARGVDQPHARPPVVIGVRMGSEDLAGAHRRQHRQAGRTVPHGHAAVVGVRHPINHVDLVLARTGDEDAIGGGVHGNITHPGQRRRGRRRGWGFRRPLGVVLENEGQENGTA